MQKPKTPSELKIRNMNLSRERIGTSSGRLSVFAHIVNNNAQRQEISTIAHQLSAFNIPNITLVNESSFIPVNEILGLSKLLLTKEITLETQLTQELYILPKITNIKVRGVLNSPTSGKEKNNNYELVKSLTERDELVSFIRTRQDYDWFMNILNIMKPKTNVFLVPEKGVYGRNLWRWAEKEQRVKIMLDLEKSIQRK